MNKKEYRQTGGRVDVSRHVMRGIGVNGISNTIEWASLWPMPPLSECTSPPEGGQNSSQNSRLSSLPARVRKTQRMTINRPKCVNVTEAPAEGRWPLRRHFPTLRSLQWNHHHTENQVEQVAASSSHPLQGHLVCSSLLSLLQHCTEYLKQRVTAMVCSFQRSNIRRKESYTVVARMRMGNTHQKSSRTMGRIIWMHREMKSSLYEKSINAMTGVPGNHVYHHQEMAPSRTSNNNERHPHRN